MPDMRYSARVQANEIMGRVHVVVEVWSLEPDPTERDRRVYRRSFDCDPAGEAGSALWVRDLLVEVAEYL